MTSDDEKRKQLKDSIWNLLQTTEELKIALAPLIESQKDTFKILNSHEKAIGLLMDELLGKKEEHAKRSELLELMESNSSEMREKQDEHEKDLKLLEKRLKRIEWKQIQKINNKIKKHAIQNDDLIVIEELLEYYPDDDQLIFLKLDVLKELQMKNDALEYIEKSILERGATWKYLEKKSEFLSDLEEKIKILDKALSLTDKPINKHIVWFDKAGAFNDVEKFEDALFCITKSLEEYNECAGAWSFKASILRDLKRMPEALGCSNKALELETDPVYKSKVLNIKATILASMGKEFSSDALDSFDESIELDKSSPYPHINKGKLLATLDKPDEALDSLEAAIAIDKKIACAWCEKAILLNHLHRDSEALPAMKKAIDLNPPKRCIRIFVNNCIILNNLGKIRELSKFLNLIPNKNEILKECEPNMLNHIGWAFFKDEYKYSEASEIVRIALEEEPENPYFLDTLACNLFAAGKDDESLETFELAMKFKENDEPISWDVLARLYKKLGKTEEEMKATKKAEEKMKKV